MPAQDYTRVGGPTSTHRVLFLTLGNLRDAVVYEYVGNLHTHTVYSDGHGRHNDLAAAAIHAGIDFIVTTDHNVLVGGIDGYRYEGSRRVLLITGEEIHDPARDPQKNHLLVYEAGHELAQFARDPQALIDAVQESGGLCFLAHPVDPQAPLFGESDLSWVDWQVRGFQGLEIWNFMTEFKSHLTSWPRAIYYAYRPDAMAKGPFAPILARWDRLLDSGERVWAIGGADAHALPYQKGPFRRVIFPYEYLFRAVNTHVLTATELRGEAQTDRSLLFGSLRRGNCFVGYDLPASTRGFRFFAEGENGRAEMGSEVGLGLGVTLQIKTPRRCRIRLLRSGDPIATWERETHAVQNINRPGIYRVEADIHFMGQWRSWIISNPIFAVEQKSRLGRAPLTDDV